ncbi:hypothetical protein GOODEAATRI_007117, partial [Goodea atripinnis]
WLPRLSMVLALLCLLTRTMWDTENYQKQTEMITFVQFANDECDYGMGYELGIDLFCYGSHVSLQRNRFICFCITFCYHRLSLTTQNDAVSLRAPCILRAAHRSTLHRHKDSPLSAPIFFTGSQPRTECQAAPKEVAPGTAAAAPTATPNGPPRATRPQRADLHRRCTRTAYGRWVYVRSLLSLH